MTIAQLVIRLLNDENAPPDARAAVQAAVESVAPHDRRSFADFVDAVDTAGGLPPRWLNEALPALMRVSASDRPAFVDDVAHVFAALRSLQESRPDAGMHLDILHNLAALPGRERRQAAQLAIDRALSAHELHCLLGHMTALGSPDLRQRFVACLDALQPTFDILGGLQDMARVLAQLGIDRAERSIGCLREHFPALIIPHPRSAELVHALGRLDVADVDPFVALIKRLDQVASASNPDGSPWVNDTLNNLLSLARMSAAERKAVVDELVQHGRGCNLNNVFDQYFSWKASLERFASQPQEKAQRLVVMEEVATLLFGSTDTAAALTRWIARLPTDTLQDLQRGLDALGSPPSGLPLERATIRAALRLWPPGGAVVDAARADAAWQHCVTRIVDQKQMAPPWNTLPLSLLVPYRGDVVQGLKNQHPHCMDRKRFDLNDPEHRMVDYLRVLVDPHLTKFLSVDRNSEFCFEDAQKVQNDPGLREHFSREATRVNGFEAGVLAYEAQLFDRQMLQPARQRAQKLGIPLVLWLNVTSGATAGTPLALAKLQEQGVDVIAAKQPSTRNLASADPLGVAPLPPDVLPRFFGRPKAPLVLVCDFTCNDRYPHSFQRFRNLAAVINDAWSKPAYEAWRHAGLDDTPYQPRSSEQQALLEKARSMAAGSTPPENGLTLHYATTSGKPFKTSLGETPAAFDWHQVQGPGFVCVQTSLSHEEIEERARAGDAQAAELIREANALHIRHKRGYFDDNHRAQTPLPYPSKRGNFKLNPPVHRKARDAFKQSLRQHDR